MRDLAAILDEFRSAESGLLPPTHPNGPRRMLVSTRPQDWASPARETLFGFAGPGGAEGSGSLRGVAAERTNAGLVVHRT